MVHKTCTNIDKHRRDTAYLVLFNDLVLILTDNTKRDGKATATAKEYPGFRRFPQNRTRRKRQSCGG